MSTVIFILATIIASAVVAWALEGDKKPS